MRKARRRRLTCMFAALAMATNIGAALASSFDEIVDPPLAARDLATSLQPPAASKHTSTSLDDVDALAALDGIRIALTEVADGSSYVWHRRDGVLSGMAQPNTSFKDAAGLPCRNLTVMLNTYGRSSRIDGVACRNTAGRWNLAG